MSEIEIKFMPVGMLAVNCVVVKKDDQALIFDPGADPDAIKSMLNGAKPVAVILTHSHFDHAGAIDELLEEFDDCEYLCHPECDRLAQDPHTNLSMLIGGIPVAISPATRTIEGGQTLQLAGIEIETFHVPGHSPGQLCFYIKDAGTVICGDTVFNGGIGRSDFPGGDGDLLVEKILQMLNSLPPQTKLIPGHGSSTTAGYELKSNPYLR